MKLIKAVVANTLALWLVYPISVAAVQAPLMSQGASLMFLADALAARSRESIQRSNELRKAIGGARVQLKNIEQAEHRQWLQQQIELQLKHLQSWKKQGVMLREQSGQLARESRLLFKQGMIDHWRHWITNSGPLPSSADQAGRSFAHNTLVRSVHRAVPTPAQAAVIKTDEAMSLQVSAISGQELPVGLDLESFSISRDRKYFAHIEVAPQHSNAAAQIPLNRLHTWRVIVSTVDGQALSGSTIEFSGHMPGHVHGLPTQPRVDKELAPGVYQVSGVKFQMRGWWVIEFIIHAEGDSDSVRFNVVL